MREKRFKVVFSPAAVRDVESLDDEASIPLVKDILAYLETRPLPIGKPRIKKLSGFEPALYRMRSSDFRAYYRIRGGEIVVLAVTRRKDSDKRLKRISEKRRRYRRGPILAGLLLITATIAQGCRGRDQGPSRTISGGVEIVENGAGIYPVKGEPKALTLREEFRIDLEDDSVAATGLTDIDTLDVDARGRIYLFRAYGPGTTERNIVFRFDERGRFMRSFGRVGQGPSEIENPRFMRMTAKDEIPIACMGYRVVFFDTEGRVVRTTALPTGFLPLPRGFLPLANGDYIISYLRVDPETHGSSGYGVGLFGPDFAKRLDLRTYPVPNNDSLRTPFFDFPVVGASETAIFLTSVAPTREIEVYDLGGRLVRKILADYPAVRIPAGFREEYLGPLPRDNPLWKNLVFPNTFPPFKALFTDDHGRLYAVGYGKDPGTGANVCDIFSPDGVRILRAALGYQALQGLRPLDAVVKNDRLYCVREKPSGYAEVLVYSLHWTAD